MINTTRHQEYILNTDLQQEINIIGCGSIGTILATTLARIGFTNFTLYDDDKVEEHNIANQYFESKDLEKQKVTALKEKILEINEHANIKEINEKITKEKPLIIGGIAAICVDSMEARNICFQKLKDTSVLLIDGRMGGLHGQLHFVDMNEEFAQTTYEKTLYSDEQTTNLPCTARTIIYTVQLLCSVMAQTITTELNEQKNIFKTININTEEKPTIQQLITIPLTKKSIHGGENI